MKKSNFIKLTIIISIVLVFFSISSPFQSDYRLKLFAKIIEFKYIEELNETIYTVYYEWEWTDTPKIRSNRYDMIRFHWPKGFTLCENNIYVSNLKIQYKSTGNKNLEKEIFFPVETSAPVELANEGVILFPEKIYPQLYPYKGKGNITIRKSGKNKNVGILVSYIKGVKFKNNISEKIPDYDTVQIIESTTIHGLEMNIEK